MRKEDHHSYDYFSDPWNASTYQTGSTTPPKNRNGIIAGLLVVVIVLCGIITVLGITNVKLLGQLDQQSLGVELPISFSDDRHASSLMGLNNAPSPENAARSGSIQGLEGESVPQLYQIYYHLPEGFYVNYIHPDCAASCLDLQPGDIITAVNGIPISGPWEFQEVLEQAKGNAISLSIFRNSRLFQVELPLEKV